MGQPLAFGQPANGQPLAAPVNYGDPNAPGYNAPGYNAPGYTSTGYSSAGYPSSGYVANGYNSSSVREDGYYSSVRRPIYVHNATEYQQEVVAPVYGQPGYVERGPDYVEPRRYTQHTTTYVRERPRYYRDDAGHRRSTGKSVAIVAGSAGAGAAIGAIAGGLAGGGAGFIYDRLTHNHVH
jgi:hypothetical protein